MSAHICVCVSVFIHCRLFRLCVAGAFCWSSLRVDIHTHFLTNLCYTSRGCASCPLCELLILLFSLYLSFFSHSSLILTLLQESWMRIMSLNCCERYVHPPLLTLPFPLSHSYPNRPRIFRQTLSHECESCPKLLREVHSPQLIVSLSLSLSLSFFLSFSLSPSLSTSLIFLASLSHSLTNLVTRVVDTNHVLELLRKIHSPQLLML